MIILCYIIVVIGKSKYFIYCEALMLYDFGYVWHSVIIVGSTYLIDIVL